MVKVKLFKQDGSQQGEVELNDQIFGIEPNKGVVHEAVIMQRASQRQGTHKVKSRSEVRGGGRKPWRQKGTGRARHGSIRSPQWVGGGRAFGPTPRSYAYKLPKKVRRLALKSALSMKVAEDSFVVVEGLRFESPKTKDFKETLTRLDIQDKVLLVIEHGNENAFLSARNLANVKVVDEGNVSVLDLVWADKVLITQGALNTVEEALA